MNRTCYDKDMNLLDTWHLSKPHNKHQCQILLSDAKPVTEVVVIASAICLLPQMNLRLAAQENLLRLQKFPIFQVA